MKLLFQKVNFDAVITGGGGGGGTPYNGLYGEAPPERGTFFRQHAFGNSGGGRSLFSFKIWKFRRGVHVGRGGGGTLN